MVDRTVYSDADHTPDLPLRQIFGRQRVPTDLCKVVADAGLLTVETFAMLGDTIAAVKQTVKTMIGDDTKLGADLPRQELSLTSLAAVWRTCSTMQEHFAARRAKMEEDPNKVPEIPGEDHAEFRQQFIARHPDVVLPHHREPHRKFVERLQRDFMVHGAVNFYEVGEMRTRNEQIAQKSGISRSAEDLLKVVQDPEEVGRLLSLMRKIQEILERCGMTELLDDPAALEAVLQRYKAMKAAFEAHGFDELFEDPVKLESFLGTHRQVRDVFEEFQQMHLLEDAEAARSFFQQRQLDLEDSFAAMTSEESSSTATTLKSLEAEMAELRRQLQDLQEQREAMRASFEKHGFRPLFDDVEKLDSFLQSHREVRDVFQEANHEDLLEDAEKARIFLQMFDQTEDDRRFMAKLREVFEEAGQSRLLEEYEATTDAGDDDHADEEAEDEEDDAEADDAEEAEEADEPDERDEDVDEDEEGEEEEGEPRESLKDKPSEDTDELHTASKGKTVAAAPIRPQQSFRALRAHLFRTNAFERFLREVGMEHLLDDPNELGRLLRLLKELMSILETYGLKEVEHDPTRLAEVLSAYRALEAAFKEYDMSELFEDPEYSLKAFLRNHHRIRAEFDKYGLGYLFDSEMGRLESRLLKKEEEIEALKERLKEFEQLGDVETIQKWKADSEELKRITRLYNSVSSRLAELERLLAAKEREREEAEARERMMAVKYKELMHMI
eukprot:g8024.t1